MALPKFDEIADTFQSVDPEMRMQLLLDFSRRLPPLPGKFVPLRDAGMHRVPECMTPVFLFVERADGDVKIHIDVAEEAPTVKGLMAIILRSCEGASPQEVADLPDDMLRRLGLGDLIRMNRVIGLSAIVSRIKRQVLAAVGGTAAPQN